MSKVDEASGQRARPTRRVVFLDFDGTITATETFVAMMKRFAPVIALRLAAEMHALRLTLRDGVRRIMEAIPSRDLPAIREAARHATLRPGLVELLDFLDARQTPAVVVSGGLRVMIEATLGPLLPRFAGIHAMEIDDGGPHLRVHSDFEMGDEIVAKAAVMERYPADEWVAVGDSVTDLTMAAAAHRVFARDRLIEYLKERGINHTTWSDFHDVQRTLADHWDRASERHDERA